MSTLQKIDAFSNMRMFEESGSLAKVLPLLVTVLILVANFILIVSSVLVISPGLLALFVELFLELMVVSLLPANKSAAARGKMASSDVIT